jgi:dihydrofolate reductase
MTNLMVTTFLSLDGVVQAPGGPDGDRDGGFDHGGWGVPYIDDTVITRMTTLLNAADALLLGRRTYEDFADTWPLAADDPIGTRMNSLPKYVASRTLTEVTWNATLLTGDTAVAVAKLKAAGAQIQVHGSGTLVQTLLRADVVDEFHLVTIPVLLGTGKRLFGDGTVPGRFELVTSETAPSGAVLARYARAGDLEYGAMGPETGNW